MPEIWLDINTLGPIKEIARAINRLAIAQENANEIEKRKVTSHSLTTVYLEDEEDSE